MATETQRTTAEIPKAYRPAEVEPEVYERWLAADVFAPDGAGSRADWSKKPFVIIQPPPNVTGALHIGHALTATVEDMLIRRARMQGHPTLWLPGVDHASIAAQYVLDRLIAEEGESRQSLGRERYLERMRRFMDETRPIISSQHRRLGVSVDWSRLRFTVDEGSARAVRVSFKRLYDDGLAYRAQALINWCPGCRTSLSDLEVLSRPTQGTLWHVRYRLLDEEGNVSPIDTITVATTRPETILGDTGVAVHPDDERYRALVGRMALIPFVDRPVPIVADPVVEREFGTGAVKITPAHDQTDHETGRRHGLPVIDVMDDRARMTEAAGPFAGLDRYEVRRRILAELEARGELAAALPHEMIVGHCQRSDDVVEPRLKTQWFINVKPLAERAMAAVREGRTRILPARHEKVFFDWMENIHDWNVSRQLWWGHRIPAWHCPDGHVTVSAEEDGPSACSTCGRPATELRQDDDIFDTWYSAGLWPFSTLGWPDQTDDLRRFYPGTVMETGYDIIFFWVARMMMLGEWFMGREPFEVVYLHGMVRDATGQRMSKTKGNVVDPLGVMEEVGADALRFALVHGSAPAADQKLGRTKLEGARNFANKIWNAARFVLGSRPADIPADALLSLPEAKLLGPAEHWILARCAATTEAVERAYADFQLGEATRLLYDAIWGEYCDWYLELAKVGLTEGADGDELAAGRRQATWWVLAWVLDRYVRLLHPVMPHLTEAIWQRLPHRPDDAGLLMVSPWPAASEMGQAPDDAPARGTGELLALLGSIRTARAEAGIDPAEWLPAAIFLPPGAAREAYPELESALARIGRIRPRLVADRAELETGGGAGALSVIGGTGEARLSRSGAEMEREHARLTKELANARVQLAQTEARLGDEGFRQKAPQQVVSAAQQRAAELRDVIGRLQERLHEDA
ncbi:MAG TPA: valine--tRNA ligase [Candidatus Limnocylindria bacterium]|nr:valine--tRNA ligase [Candidatus Limnocylindria bacterium]